ncbi:3493_t:CDS:10 [Funneliformis geosporum]|uniref:3493_t:CDS:1 n=1 Tax=Funneliformis geosporum TaxID=1117311 RepID=A0A9W4SDQ3_9GLOM|nr:3493_t:CDS:10 [Funneliformis geosporum]
MTQVINVSTNISNSLLLKSSELSLKLQQSYSNAIEEIAHQMNVEFINFNGFVDVNEIKSDLYGDNVREAIWKEKSCPVFLKSVPGYSIEDHHRKFIEEIRRALLNQTCENIIQLLGVTEDPSDKSAILVIQYPKDGTLREYLAQYPDLEWFKKLNLAKDIAQGIRHLHRSGFVHGDLHAQSVFIDDGKAVIRDPGLFGFEDDETSSSSTLNSAILSTIPYVDPQVMGDMKHKPDQRSDIYSLGVIMWEISSCKPPFGKSGSQVILTMAIMVRKTHGFLYDDPVIVGKSLTNSLVIADIRASSEESRKSHDYLNPSSSQNSQKDSTVEKEKPLSIQLPKRLLEWTKNSKSSKNKKDLRNLNQKSQKYLRRCRVFPKEIIEIGKNVPLLQTASAIVEKIQEQVELQIENEEIREDIKDKVCKAQEQLNSHKLDEGKYNRAYKHYIEVLKHIDLYIKDMGNNEDPENKKKIRKKLLSFVKASYMNEVYKELIKKLDDAMKEFHFEMNIEMCSIVGNLSDKVDALVSLNYLNRGFDFNPNDIILRDTDIEKPDNNDKVVRGKSDRVQKKYYNGEAVAIIKVKFPQDQNEVDKINRAAFYHLKLSACNSILRFKGTCASSGNLHIVVEWAEYGYLELYLQEDIEIPWSERIKFSTQIASAIQFCHNSQILHHNLRSLNVLIDKDKNAKLTGFEQAKFSFEGTRPLSNQDGMRFSVLLWEIASRKKPFENILTEDLLAKLPEQLQADKGPGEIGKDTPPKFKSIIDSCGSLEQEDRLDIKQVSKELNTLYLSNFMRDNK